LATRLLCSPTLASPLFIWVSYLHQTHLFPRCTPFLALATRLGYLVVCLVLSPNPSLSCSRVASTSRCSACFFVSVVYFYLVYCPSFLVLVSSRHAARLTVSLSRAGTFALFLYLFPTTPIEYSGVVPRGFILMFCSTHLVCAERLRFFCHTYIVVPLFDCLVC
jgi:hypothetical protein